MSRTLTVAVLGALLAAGCAARALPDERVMRTVADLLGLPPGSLAIVTRTDRGTGMDYGVRGRDGATYSCEVIVPDRNSADRLSTKHRAAIAAAPPGGSPDEIVWRDRSDLPDGTTLIGHSRAASYACTRFPVVL